MIRGLIFVFLGTLLSLTLTSCDEVRKFASGCSSAPAHSDSPTSVLGIEIGMARADAEKVLNCLGKGSNYWQGTRGEFALKVNTVLREIGDDGGYQNLLVATDGTKRDCPAVRREDSGALDGNLTPDDTKFANFAIAGNAFPCYSIIRQQVAVRLGGPPDGQRVIGVWRLYAPPVGERPRLAQLIGELKQKYPTLDIERVSNPEQGFIVAGFQDDRGNSLDPTEIQASRVASPPTEPTPPATTQTCDFPYVFSTCPRPVSQSEQDSYDAALARYKSDYAAYGERKQHGDRYFACLSSPGQAGTVTIDEATQSSCGLQYFASAHPLSGGFAEAIYVGIYNPALGFELRSALNDYLKSKRPSFESTGNRTTPL
jgi:hypothetical protein